MSDSTRAVALPYQARMRAWSGARSSSSERPACRVRAGSGGAALSAGAVSEPSSYVDDATGR